MNRKKLLFENFIVYGLGGVIAKIIPFVMLPIITYLLPDESYYGVNDLVNTITSLCCEIGILGMYDSAFRFFFDSEEADYRRSVCSTTFFVSMCATFISIIGLLLFRNVIISKVYGDAAYSFLLLFNIFAIFATNISLMLSAPTRMLNKRKIFLAVNSIAPLTIYLVAIVLILNEWYLCALPLASILSAVIMCVVFYYLNKEWFSVKCIRGDLIKPLVVFGIPIFLIKIMYYVINSSDKLMIAAFLGQSYNGIYAVGAKFGSVSQLIYTAFAGGWVYYRYATMKAEDQVENTSKIYEILAIVSFGTFILSCLLARWIIVLLFKEAYYDSYIVIPYLFFAPLLQMLFQIVGGQFEIMKKSWFNFTFLLLGAGLNVLLNLVLIPWLGIEGAALATLMGYAVTAMVAALACSKVKMIIISRRFWISLLLIISFYIIWRMHIEMMIIPSIYAVIVFAIYFLMYKTELIELIEMRKRKKNDAE